MVMSSTPALYQEQGITKPPSTWQRILEERVARKSAILQDLYSSRWGLYLILV